MGEKKARGRRNQQRRKKDEAISFDDIPDLEFIDSAQPEENVQNEQNEKNERNDMDLDENEITTNAISEVAPAFFGLVDKIELDYFKQADSTLAANIFGSPEERVGFIRGVLEESKNKEMKLATNQTCSQLIERLIMVADDRQLHHIFRSFSGNFIALSKHKYSSHCLEALFLKSASLIEREMALTDAFQLYREEDEDSDLENVQVSMENLFLSMVDELKPELKVLQQHRYGSHVLRIVLLVLSGSAIPATTLRSKKSRIMRKMIDMKLTDNAETTSYQVPSSFKEPLNEVIEALIADLDSFSARQLAVDKLASPVMTCIILVQLQQNQKRAKSKLLDLVFQNSKSQDKDSAEEAFIEYLLSDPVGSHFFESIIASMPLKTIERLYNLYMQSRVDKLVRRESGNYVIQAILKRLKPNKGKQVLDQLIGEIEILLATSIPMVKAIVETAARLNYRVNDIANIFIKKYEISHGNKDQFPEKLLKLEDSTLGNTKDDWPTAQEMNRSLLVQVLVKAVPQFLNYALLGLLRLPEKRLIDFAKHSVFSHVLEACLVPQADTIVRRKLLNVLCKDGVIVDLACNAYGSHSIERLWQFTYKLKFFREQIADQLAKQSELVKASRYGVRVWKNWKLEKYVRKRHEWWVIVKASEDQIAEKLGDSRGQKGKLAALPEVRPTFKRGSTIGAPRGGSDKRSKKNYLHSKKPYDRPATTRR